jgi:ABC-type transporter Mla subunit MlaD
MEGAPPRPAGTTIMPHRTAPEPVTAPSEFADDSAAGDLERDDEVSEACSTAFRELMDELAGLSRVAREDMDRLSRRLDDLDERMGDVASALAELERRSALTDDLAVGTLRALRALETSLDGATQRVEELLYETDAVDATLGESQHRLDDAAGLDMNA